MPSPELKAWLQLRENAFKLRRMVTDDGGHVSLRRSAIDPNELEEPLRTEAINTLKLNKAK